MRSINKPLLDPGKVFSKCISKVRNNDLRQRLEKVKPLIENAAKDYDEKGANSNLYLFLPHDNIGGVISSDEMKIVYTSRMVHKTAPGREFYDYLRSIAPEGVCPFCGQRVVSTLDHYLPKKKYPFFTVLPNNLIPSCGDCNKIKDDTEPTGIDNQYIHPYFDELGGAQWLFAKFDESKPLSFKFYVDPPTDWASELKAKIEYHFKTLKLDPLFRAQAANELCGNRHQMSHILARSDSSMVKKFLKERCESWRTFHVNSWQAAMYQAMSESEWLCDGGFEL